MPSHRVTSSGNDDIDFAACGRGRLGQVARRRPPALAPHRRSVMKITIPTMQIVACSRLPCWRSTPVSSARPPPSLEKNVRSSLRKSLRGNGIVWSAPSLSGSAHQFASVPKRLASDGVLTECVGQGFGMRLDVYEENHAPFPQHALFSASASTFRCRISCRRALPVIQQPRRRPLPLEMTIRHAVFGTCSIRTASFTQTENHRLWYSQSLSLQCLLEHSTISGTMKSPRICPISLGHAKSSCCIRSRASTAWFADIA
jgi:hypothetical protein